MEEEEEKDACQDDTGENTAPGVIHRGLDEVA